MNSTHLNTMYLNFFLQSVVMSDPQCYIKYSDTDCIKTCYLYTVNFPTIGYMFRPVMLLNCPTYIRYDIKRFNEIYRAVMNPLKKQSFSSSILKSMFAFLCEFMNNNLGSL